MEDKKKTAGSIILEHDAKRLDLEDDIIEYRRQMEPDMIKRLYAAADQAKNHDLYKGKDFYVVLVTIPDRVLRMPKIIPVVRKSCPTPVYNQSVWKYKTGTGDLEFLWSIPGMFKYYDILKNKFQYINDKEWADLAKFVILMESGELLEWVKRENGNKKDGIIKITKEEPQCLMN